MRAGICLFFALAFELGVPAIGQQIQTAASQQSTQGVTNSSTQLMEQGSYCM